MSFISARQWEALERWRATAFLIGGAIFVINAAIVVVRMSEGTEPAAFAQAFVGAGWTAAFIGLIGFFPSLADRSRWLVRIGAVFSVIGAITMAAMAAASLGYSTGVLGGELGDVIMFFLPGVFLGIVLGFGSFALASLRTPIYSRRVGLLFLLLPMTFLFNLGTGIAGIGGQSKILGVVTVLALAMLAIGYLLRTGNARADSTGVEVSSDVSTG